jgi:hypothetical protein
MIGSTFAYAGVMLLVAGLALTVRPIATLGVATRARALLVAGAGALLGVASLAAPAFTSRVSAPASRLDALTPEWQFHEVHRLHIAAAPERVYRALREVRADDITFFHALTWIRRFGRPAPPGIMNAGGEPIVAVALKGGFVALAEDAPRELVIGTVVGRPPGPRVALTPALLASPPPGFALATMNFLVTPDGANGSWISTETRVVTTNTEARRVFAAYWRVIYPGSSLIRRMWLRAIERRAVAVPG